MPALSMLHLSMLGAVDTRYIMGRVYATVFPLKNIEWNAVNPF